MPAKQRKKTMHVWRELGFATFYCARCCEKGWAREPQGVRLDPAKAMAPRAVADKHHQEAVRQSRIKAQNLWRRRQPIAGTIAEVYLRHRGYRGPLPPTLGFLPPWRDHLPALIGAFGLACEVGPGVIAIADHAVVGVHMTKLKPDGTDRLRDEDAKITIGRNFVAPIVLAPPNDLLALTIGEGIEKVLADHAVSGAGAWVSASAVRLPALATLVPGYIEGVTILVDDNEIGRTKSGELAAALHARGIEVMLTPVGEGR
jgi:hypothetical protein